MFPFFLNKRVHRNYDLTRRECISTLYSITDSPTVFNWLLRAYATNRAIYDAVDELLRTIKCPTEDDIVYSNRFIDAHSKCG